MSIIIHGLDMPKYTTKAEFGIDADGNPLCIVYQDGTEPDIYDVIPLPEGHGRLIDADALSEKMRKTPRYFDVKFDLESAPTIVPAEGGTDNG